MGIPSVFKLGFIGLLLSMAALYFRYYDLSKLNCKLYKMATPPELIGPLSVNSALENVEYILKDNIHGPESIVVEGESIFATTHDAKVVKIVDGRVVKTVKFNHETGCGSYDTEPRCGRPLGLRRFDKEQFIVADAYLGLFLVNIEKEIFKQIFRSTTPIEGQVARFLNDVDVLNADELIVSDTSIKWNRRHVLHAILEMAGDGRVFHYKISTGKATVLLNGLQFANGVQILPDRQSFLVAETGMARIKRHFIAGPRKGETEIFAENLPGLPDNIRLSQNNTLWIGMAGVRHTTKPSFVDFLAGLPHIRQFLIDIIPKHLWIQMIPYIKAPHALIIQTDLDGHIISSLHDVTGKYLEDISQVTDEGDYLYFGSFHSKYIARLRKF